MGSGTPLPMTRRLPASVNGASLRKILAFKMRAYPNGAQRAALDEMLRDFCALYNAGLQQRIEAWRRQRKSLSYMTQTMELKACRAAAVGLERWSFTAEMRVLRRLDHAIQRFFDRLKSGGAPGYPRFRSAARYHAADFKIGDGMALKAGRVRIVGVPGDLKVKWHRPLPNIPTSAVLTRQNGKWFVVFQVEVDEASERVTGSIGVDAGLTSLVALSTGETIERPNWTRRAAKALRKRQRALARCARGSKRRAKARHRVAVFHKHTSNRRADMLHKLSAGLVARFSDIAVEDLNTISLARAMLAKEVHDAAWAQLISMLDYKAAKAGGRVVKVDPRGTSQTCPECGLVKPKELSERMHRCECGCTLDRDVAAAKIIHLRAFGHGACLRTPSQRVAA